MGPNDKRLGVLQQEIQMVMADLRVNKRVIDHLMEILLSGPIMLTRADLKKMLNDEKYHGTKKQTNDEHPAQSQD